MPSSFSALGMQFLYPDNWVQQSNDQSEADLGVVFDLPSGGFFSIERLNAEQDNDLIVSELADAFGQEYGEVESEELAVDAEAMPGVLRAIEHRFYYLDLLIISRLMFLEVASEDFVCQYQSESRDFEKNEMVITAILKQISNSA